jgi:uncharacterized protein (UPF0261 family)
MAKTIVLVGTLDTKGKEIKYCRDLTAERGFDTIVIDVGILNRPFIPGDYTRSEVAKLGGVDLTTILRKGDKNFGIQTMTDGARQIVKDLYLRGKLNGIFALGGGQGTYIGTSVMKELPLGIPKVMVSTLTAGDIQRFVGTKDIVMFNPVTDILGINAISGQLLKNAVAALAGMISVAAPVTKSSRTTVGLSMLGTTTVGAMKVVNDLEESGLEMITFHANGPGGAAMEELTAAGYFDAMLEYSPHQITAEVCHGIFTSGPDRLMAAARKGIPQLIVPGGLDNVIQGPFETMPAEHQKRPHIIHNKNITLVRVSEAEMVTIAKTLAEKLNSSCGPVRVVIPLQGYCEPNHEGGPFYNPQADQAFVATLEKALQPEISLIKVDAHINDSQFADRVIAEFKALLSSIK